MSAQTPTITDHAVLRYRMRVDPSASESDVAAAFKAATDPVPSQVRHHEGRKHYHAETGAVFISTRGADRGAASVMTVLLADPRGGRQ